MTRTMICVSLFALLAVLPGLAVAILPQGYTEGTPLQFSRSVPVLNYGPPGTSKAFTMRLQSFEQGPGKCNALHGNPKKYGDGGLANILADGCLVSKWLVTSDGQTGVVDWPLSGISGRAADAAGGRKLLQTCDILNLILGPLHLDLLGLVVDLNQVILDITGEPGGGLLGSLLCGLLGPNGLTSFNQLLGLLNQLLGSLGAIG